jgi:hypothetical protein
MSTNTDSLSITERQAMFDKWMKDLIPMILADDALDEITETTNQDEKAPLVN